MAAREVWDSFHATQTTGRVRLVYLVDDDDQTRGEYPGFSTYLGESYLPVLQGEPTGDPTGPLNIASRNSQADVVGFMGDDSRFETKGWDEQVLSALEKPGFCWGEDGNQRPWPSTVFITKKIVDTLGWMVHPSLRRGFFDVQWLTLANLTDSTRVIPAMFRHDNSAGDPQSPNFKKEAQVPPEVIASDEIAFNLWVKNDSRKDAQKIRHALYA